MKIYTCHGCGREYMNRQVTKFCSCECYANHKIRQAEKKCLCCGKTFYRRGLGRTKAKAGDRLHNAFCSKACAAKYHRWETDRKARCKHCGKKTGRRGKVCMECSGRAQSPLLKALKASHSRLRRRVASRNLSPIERKAKAWLVSLRKRAPPGKPQPKRMQPTSTLEALLQARRRQCSRQSRRDKMESDPLHRWATNRVGNLRKRRRRREALKSRRND